MPTLDELLSDVFLLPEGEWAGAVERLCETHATHAERLRRRFSILRELGLDRSPPAALPQDVPQRLGRFRIVERLGGGGMGVVYRAVEEPLEREVALKLVRPEHLFFPDARERFEREVRAVARMNHPGIVQIHAVGEEAGVPYCAMEIVVGMSLADLIQELAGRDLARLAGERVAAIVAAASGAAAGSWDRELFAGGWLQVACRIARRVAEALAHAHARGIVHRDVKPSNVMLTADGRVVLLDFGLAFAERVDRMTRAGTMLGSLAYMPPEQVRGDLAAIDARSDIYSLGVTLYEMLALVGPFDGDSAETTRRRILAGTHVSLRVRNRGVPADLATVCAKAFELDPKRRYANAADLAADLANVLAGREVMARPSSRAVRWRRLAARHPGWAVALAGSVLLLAGGPTAITLAVAAQRDRAQVAEYAARITAANAALAANDAVAAAVSLQHCDPALRGWEWRHLSLALDGSLRTLRGHRDRPTAVALDAEGTKCASGGKDGEVVLWEVATGTRLRSWSAGAAAVEQLVFGRAGSTLVVRLRDGRLSVFDLASGACTAERAPGPGYERCHVVAGATAIWVDRGGWQFTELDPETLVTVRELRLQPAAGVPTERFVADARGLHALTPRRTASWDLGDGTLRQASAPFTSEATCVALDPRGRWLAWGQKNGQVRLQDVAGRDETRVYEAGPQPVERLAFSSDGALLVVASQDRALRVIVLWSGETSMVLHGHVDRVNDVACAGELCLVATAADDHTVRIWSALCAPHQLQLRGHTGDVLRLAVLDGGRRVVSTSADGTGRIWSPETGVPLATLAGHLHWVHLLAVSPDSQRLVTAYHNHLFRRDAQGGSAEEPLSIGDTYLWSAAYLRDGRRAVVGDRAGRLFLYDLDSGTQIGVVQAHRAPLSAVAVSADGRRVLTGGEDGAVHSWLLDPLRHERELLAGGGPVRALCFRSRGELVVGEGCHLRFCDAQTGVVRADVVFRAEVMSLAELADGSRVLVGGDDGRLAFVDPRDGTTMLSLRAASGPVVAIACDPGGRWFVTGGDSVCRVWRAEPLLAPGAWADAGGVLSVQAAVHHENQVLIGSTDYAGARGALERLGVSAALRETVDGLLRVRQFGVSQMDATLIGLMTDPRPVAAAELAVAERLAHGVRAGVPAGSLGTALFDLRSGRAQAALATADAILAHQNLHAVDVCYLSAVRVMALASLGRTEEARAALVTLHARCSEHEPARDPEALALLRQAQDAVTR